MAAFMQKKIEGVLIDAFDISEKVIRDGGHRIQGYIFLCIIYMTDKGESSMIL